MKKEVKNDIVYLIIGSLLSLVAGGAAPLITNEVSGVVHILVYILYYLVIMGLIHKIAFGKVAALKFELRRLIGLFFLYNRRSTNVFNIF